MATLSEVGDEEMDMGDVADGMLSAYVQDIGSPAGLLLSPKDYQSIATVLFTAATAGVNM